MRTGEACLVVGLMAVVAGCATRAPATGDAVPPAACVAPRTAAQEVACLDAIAHQLEVDATRLADGAPITHALFFTAQEPVLRSLGTATLDGWDYELSTATGDLETEQRSTAPLAMRWRIGGTARVLHACFGEGGVTVGEEPCA